MDRLSTRHPELAALWEDSFFFYLQVCSPLRGLLRAEGWTAVHAVHPSEPSDVVDPSQRRPPPGISARLREHARAVSTTSWMPAEDLGAPTLRKEPP